MLSLLHRNKKSKFSQSVLCYESFPFVIYDCVITQENKFLLLTSCGFVLLMFPFESNQRHFIVEANELFNMNTAISNHLTNVITNHKRNIFIVFSNTNIFFIYEYNSTSHSFNMLNKHIYLTNHYITSIDIDIITNTNNITFFSKYGHKCSNNILT